MAEVEAVVLNVRECGVLTRRAHAVLDGVQVGDVVVNGCDAGISGVLARLESGNLGGHGLELSHDHVNVILLSGDDVGQVGKRNMEGKDVLASVVAG